MKYLHKFLQHLNESQDITDLSKEELDEMLLPIKDLEIEYSFQNPRTITEGEYEGYTSMNIVFRSNFKTGPMGGYTDGTAISSLPTYDATQGNQNSMQPQQLPNYDAMYRQDTTPLVGAASPGMSEGMMPMEPAPANLELGRGSFGSW